MKATYLVREMAAYLKETRNWWLTPILTVLVLLSAFIIVTESAAVVPFIYALF